MSVTIWKKLLCKPKYIKVLYLFSTKSNLPIKFGITLKILFINKKNNKEKVDISVFRENLAQKKMNKNSNAPKSNDILKLEETKISCEYS
jgi:hypothetical protein